MRLIGPHGHLHGTETAEIFTVSDDALAVAAASLESLHGGGET